jgi:hypothetical protein
MLYHYEICYVPVTKGVLHCSLEVGSENPGIEYRTQGLLDKSGVQWHTNPVRNLLQVVVVNVGQAGYGPDPCATERRLKVQCSASVPPCSCLCPFIGMCSAKFSKKIIGFGTGYAGTGETMTRQ